MAVIYKNWHLPTIDTEKINQLASVLMLPKIICALLAQEIRVEPSQIQHFLKPDFHMLPEPNLLKDIDKAVQIICEARRVGREITVIGDYDVDGVTGTALLVTFLGKIGVPVSYVHPNRLTDGYGLNKNIVVTLSKKNNKGVLITVDCGISDFEAVAYAKQLGFTVIVTDHHLPPDRLPDADAIVNPLQQECKFPFKQLAGVGLAFYLTLAVRAQLRKEGFWDEQSQINLKNLLHLVAIGSIADMVPMKGANRILVKAGLEVLNQRQGSEGVKALLHICRLNKQEVVSDDIGFQIGPRINAAGRLEKASFATELLLCDEHKKAFDLALGLETYNKQRRELTELIVQEASTLAASLIAEGKNALVLYNENWHIGLIGIVAAKLCEKFKMPTVIMGGKNVAKGSVRTIPAINIFSVLTKCKDFFITFGGHAQAAGLSIYTSRIDEFYHLFDCLVGECNNNTEVDKLSIDCVLKPMDLNAEFFDNYSRLMPFGIENHEPIFTLAKVSQLARIKVIGQNKDHLSFALKFADKWIQGVGFGFGRLADRLVGNKVNIAFSVRTNWFRGQRTFQIHLRDILFIT